MGNSAFWKRFEKSGSVKDYLEYACTLEAPKDFYEDCFEDECYNDYDEYDDEYDNRYGES